MEYDGLTLVFYAVIALVALVVALMALKLLYRNLPLWLFEGWPWLAGLAAGAALFLYVNWIAGVVAFGVGIATGLAWGAALKNAQQRGRTNSKLEHLHWRLIQWAQR